MKRGTAIGAMFDFATQMVDVNVHDVGKPIEIERPTSIAPRAHRMRAPAPATAQADPKRAAGSQYNGKPYYFCSTSCKTKFDASPGQFAK